MPSIKKYPAKPVATTKKTEIPHLENFVNEVKARAFDIFLKRSEKALAGDEISDWVKAEKEIKAKYGIK